MRRLTILVTAVLCLAAATAYAQQPPGQTPPPQTPPQTQTPPAPAPAQKPAATQAAPAQFPTGARMAYLNVQVIASDSVEGKAAATKITDFQTTKTNELAAKNKALEAAQQKLSKSGSVMSDDARAQLQKEVDKQTLEIQRAQQDAQTELEELNRQLNADFQRKLAPIIQQVSIEKGVIILFSRGPDSGIVWADPALDLTADILKRFDASVAKPSVPKPPKH